MLRNKRGRDSERPAHRDEEWPPLAGTGESARTETKTQHTQKKRKSTLTDEKGKKAMLRDRAVEATSQGVEMEEINKQRKVVLKLKSHGSETK